MAKLRVHNFSMSIDGYAAGPSQGLNAPLGVGGERLHYWVFETEHGRSMIGTEGGTTGVDDEFIAVGDDGIGATVMGRNMFGPVRGEWGDTEWRGWWGPNPPYHHPVFVLTHHPHDPIEMDGGTTFHFVTDGIEAALDRAYTAADRPPCSSICGRVWWTRCTWSLHPPCWAGVSGCSTTSTRASAVSRLWR